MKNNLKWKAMKTVVSVIGAAFLCGTVAFAGLIDCQANEKIDVERGRFYGNYIVTESRKIPVNIDKFEHDAYKASDGDVLFTKADFPVRNDVPVYVKISDKGTPENISDDEIIMIGFAFCEYIEEGILATETAIQRNWEFINRNK